MVAWQDGLEQWIDVGCKPSSPRAGVLMDWVVVAAHVCVDDDGSEGFLVSTLQPDRQADYRALGLLEHARSLMVREIENRRAQD